jgi:hypothetical protein
MNSNSCYLCCSMYFLCRLCCSMYFLCRLCCSMYCLCQFCFSMYCVWMSTVLLPPGGYPIAVKYIISYHIIIALKFNRLWRIAFQRLPTRMTENSCFWNWCAKGALLLRKIVLSAAICDRFWPRRCCKHARNWKSITSYHEVFWRSKHVTNRAANFLVTNFKTESFLDPTTCRLGELCLPSG